MIGSATLSLIDLHRLAIWLASFHLNVVVFLVGILVFGGLGRLVFISTIIIDSKFVGWFSHSLVWTITG